MPRQVFRRESRTRGSQSLQAYEKCITPLLLRSGHTPGLKPKLAECWNAIIPNNAVFDEFSLQNTGMEMSGAFLGENNPLRSSLGLRRRFGAQASSRRNTMIFFRFISYSHNRILISSQDVD
eukprot:748008-Prorocentrum_minimum.AAC.1